VTTKEIAKEIAKESATQIRKKKGISFSGDIFIGIWSLFTFGRFKGIRFKIV
jgi:hypothetical protein